MNLMQLMKQKNINTLYYEMFNKRLILYSDISLAFFIKITTTCFSILNVRFLKFMKNLIKVKGNNFFINKVQKNKIYKTE